MNRVRSLFSPAVEGLAGLGRSPHLRRASWLVLLLLPLLLGACGLAELTGGGPEPIRAGLSAPATVLPSADATSALEPAPQLASHATATVPLPTLEPTFTSTPARPAIRQLTTGGCCVGPVWSPDGSRVLYIDKPTPDAPAGLWGAALAGGAPELFTDRLGFYSADMQLRVFPQGGKTVVERLAEGQQWVIPSEGRSVSFSPDGAWVAWTAGQDGPPFDQPVRSVWVSRSDGSEAREVIRLYGGGFSGWFPDGRLLVSGRLDPAEETQAYLVVPLSGGAPVELARGERLRGALISPQGTWLVYLVTFSDGPVENGLWLANTTTGEKRRLEIFGAYRWRDDGRLLVVPLDLTQPVHRLLQVEAASGVSQPLTDPQLEPFKIANGDWSISPDGRAIAFVSAVDNNIWLIELPSN